MCLRVPFFLSDIVATGPLIFAVVKPHVSPARIAVSIAKRKAGPTRCFTRTTAHSLKPLASVIRLISSCDIRRPRDSGFFGLARTFDCDWCLPAAWLLLERGDLLSS